MDPVLRPYLDSFDDELWIARRSLLVNNIQRRTFREACRRAPLELLMDEPDTTARLPRRGRGLLGPNPVEAGSEPPEHHRKQKQPTLHQTSATAHLSTNPDSRHGQLSVFVWSFRIAGLPAYQPASVRPPAEIDSWVSHLSQCKQLTEADVKRLCEKVSDSIKFSLRKTI